MSESTTTSSEPKKKRAKKKRPVFKSLGERMIEAARAGDPDRVFKEFESSTFGREEHWAQYQKLLRTAMEKGGDQDPEITIRFLMNRVLVFDGMLLLRAQSHVSHILERCDRSCPENMGEIPRELADEWLPRVAKLEDAVKTTCRMYSQTIHVMELAQAKARESKNVIAFEPPPEKGAGGA